MSMPRVLNRRSVGIPDNSIYVGRPTKWGNPFEIGKDGDRKEVIAKYREWIITQPSLVRDIKRVLKGKDLVCWCYPLPCHAEVLLKIANE